MTGRLELSPSSLASSLHPDRKLTLGGNYILMGRNQSVFCLRPFERTFLFVYFWSICKPNKTKAGGNKKVCLT